MKKLTLPLVAFFFLALSCSKEKKNQITFEPIPVKYPETYRDTSIKDNYHGKIVADPYRWLEDDRAPEVEEWVRRQNEVTFGYLSKIPYRNAIRKRLEELFDYERYGTPFKEGDHYYFFKNDGLQNQSVLYRQTSLDGTPEEVLDPNRFSEDGTAALGAIAFDREGKWLAYQVSEGGSDWRFVYVKDLENDRLLPDAIQWVKFSGIAWWKDGFFYSRYPEPKEGEELSAKNEFHQVYYHRLGTSQEEDELVFADRANPNRGFSAQTTEDERFLVVSVWESTSGNAVYFKDLSKPSSDFVEVVGTFDNDFVLVGNFGGTLLFRTNHQAPKWRLIAVNAEKPDAGFWEELIPQSEDVLESVDLLGDKIVATYLHNASSQVRIYDQKGRFVNSLQLPGIGTVGGFSGKQGDPEAFFSFQSFTRPSTIYRFDTRTLKVEVFKEPELVFNPDDYVTEQVWYESYDKTRVPMFLTYKKGLKKDGRRPTLLYGYGGFDIPVVPRFSPTRMVLLENGGIYAVANIRGGGEFGKEWHLAGTKERKQNVFNDFMAAAEYLIREKYTSSEKLAIEGGSNGGLLVGACMTQRPDLFRVAIPRVGVLDMLRYHKFTIGAAWATDYGRSDNPKDFDYLIAYSPVHNVEPAEYPATLVMTADHDDRVVPAHSFKFIAELQRNQKGKLPVLIRVETSAGHGAGKPISKTIEESADMLAFMLYNMEENVIYTEQPSELSVNQQ